MPAEIKNGPVIEDQELIAAGANNSQDSPSILIEYGYIYESQLHQPVIRAALVKELAWLTYLGVKNYFDPEAAAKLDDTLLLPYSFTADLQEGMRGNLAVLALQKALQRAGFYLPSNECPLNGNFGPCTRRAVMAFQTQHGLPATGYVGALTLEKLNQPDINY